MPSPDLRIVRTFDAFSEQRQALVDRITAMVLADLSGFDGWYAPQLIDQITADIAAKVSAGQIGIAALTDSYLAAVTGYVLERPVTAAGVAPTIGQVLRSGPSNLQQVYGRVMKEFRYQRSLGELDSAAAHKATVRAEEMVGTDLDLAHQRQAQKFFTTRSVTQYRRVIRSEKTCGLCAVASDRLYYSADLLPIHSRCRCGVIAVTANTDPGSQLNQSSFADLYGQAGSTKGADLKRVRITVQQNGELGPQLRIAGQNFIGPDDLIAA